MTQSMTAYGQASIETDLGELSCELRSVNHRYLEISPRMPEELRAHEGALREAIGHRLARGRIDVFIRLKENEASSLEPNIEMTMNLQSLIKLLQTQIPDMQPMRTIDILRWPGVLQARQVDSSVMKARLLAVLEQALTSMIESRVTEGAKIAKLIDQRLIGMKKVINEVEQFLPDIAENYRTRLEEKLADIKDQLDPSRLEQEMVIFLHKTDVAEELDRLNVHIEEASAVLNRPEPAGRRLDFLMQEFNREANTLGSKAQDPRLTKASVDLKVFIEQVREQVQNIE